MNYSSGWSETVLFKARPAAPDAFGLRNPSAHGPGAGDASHHAEQPEHEHDQHDAAKRNVHIGLQRRPLIRSSGADWSSGRWSKASGRATVGLDQIGTRFICRSRLLIN
jgi:hypothetical protein